MERIGVIAIRFIDFFSGIGGIRLGLEQAGNAVTVTVAHYIGKRFRELERMNNYEDE